MANEPVIQIKNLKKSFGTREVLKDINFDAHKGEVVCIIGSSGSGKQIGMPDSVCPQLIFKCRNYMILSFYISKGIRTELSIKCCI